MRLTQARTMFTDIVGGAVGGVVSAIIIGSGVAAWRLFALGRTYAVQFFEGSMFPPPRAESQEYTKEVAKVSRGGFVLIKIRVKALARLHISEIDVLLVDKVRVPKKGLRRWDSWTWRPKTGEPNTFITDLKDAEWEYDEMLHAAGRPKPLAKPNREAGYRLSFGGQGLDLLRGGFLWLTVLIQVSSDWHGFIEFQGPSSDGRRAYKRRPISLIESEPDKADRMERWDMVKKS